MRLDIYREFLLMINKELNIDGEYTLSSNELRDSFGINNQVELKEVYSGLYSRDRFYYFEDEATLEEPFLMNIDLSNNSLYFSLNPLWKRRFFSRGRLISESLMDIWSILTEGEDDKSYSKNIDLSSETDSSFSDFKRELKEIASLKGGYDQMVLIGLIERSEDMKELKRLAAKYSLFTGEQDNSPGELDSKDLSLEEYKSELRKKIHTYPSYKRMSLLGFINRADSIEVLDSVFSGESIDEDIIKKIGDSFYGERREVKRRTVILDERVEELDAYKSEIRQKVMKMSTFDKMTILGFIGKATSREEIEDIIEKYQIK